MDGVGQHHGRAADDERDQGDGDEVGVLAQARAERRVQDRRGAGRAAEGAQAQGVGDDADAAHRHRRRGEHRVEQHAEERVQQRPSRPG